MTAKNIPRALFLAIVAVGVAQGISAFPMMPERMASHFGTSGMANGWMTKTQFFAVYAITLLPAFVVEFWVSRRLATTPDARINLPNKEFWLAPERRSETLAYFDTFFAWYGCAVLLLVVFVMGLAMRANLNPPARLATGPTFGALAAFVLFNIAAIVSMLRRFSAPH